MTISTSLEAGETHGLSLHTPSQTRTVATTADRSPVAFPGTVNCVLFAAVGLTTLCLALVRGVNIDPDSFTPYVVIVLTCILLNALLSWRKPDSETLRQRLHLLLNGFVFIFVTLALLRAFNHLTMSLALPLVDEQLDGWDKALGFDWMAYFTFVQTHPFLSTVLKVAYVAFDGASLFCFIALTCMDRPARARYFCEIFLITASITIAIAMFFPAVAAVAYYFGDIAPIPGFDEVPGVAHVEQLLSVREVAVPTINLLAAEGLAAFPSFHTAGGLLLIAAFYRTRLFWYVTAFVVVMLPAVPVFGGHYLVDVLSGTVLAVAVAVVNARRPCYQGLFGKRKARH
ncbi:phosphatase PAP2 family protein [Roseibium sp. M-1]